MPAENYSRSRVVYNSVNNSFAVYDSKGVAVTAAADHKDSGVFTTKDKGETARKSAN